MNSPHLRIIRDSTEWRPSVKLLQFRPGGPLPSGRQKRFTGGLVIGHLSPIGTKFATGLISSLFCLLPTASPGGDLAKELEVLQKLESFEKDTISEATATIAQKRKEVISYLRARRGSLSAGSDSAEALRAVIDHLSELQPHDHLDYPKVEALTVPGGEKPGTKEMGQVFENLLKRLEVQAGNSNQGKDLGGEGNSVVRVAFDGQQLRRNNHPGCYVLTFNLEGLVSQQMFRDEHRAEFRKEHRESLERHLEKLPQDQIVVLAVGYTYHPFHGDGMRDVVKIIGGKTKSLDYLQPYVCIGYKGLGRGEAVEYLGGQLAGESAWHKP